MNMNESKKQFQSPVDVIDGVLQDTYLLVVTLRQGAEVPNSPQLWVLCVELIERVRQQLKQAGLSQISIDHISHAQCALLDETVLTFAKDDAHATWASEPLQAKFFNSHQAGESLYEDMREVVHQPAPDMHAVTAFQRVLMLGFHGRYRTLEAPERQLLLAALTERVAPLAINVGMTARSVIGRRTHGLSVWRSPLGNLSAIALLLLGVWWGLNHLLDAMITSLLPGQA